MTTTTSGACPLSEVQFISNPEKRKEVLAVRIPGLISKAQQIAFFGRAKVTVMIRLLETDGPHILFDSDGNFAGSVAAFQTLLATQLPADIPTEPGPARKRKQPAKENPAKRLRSQLKSATGPLFIVPSDAFASAIGSAARQRQQEQQSLGNEAISSYNDDECDGGGGCNELAVSSGFCDLKIDTSEMLLDAMTGLPPTDDIFRMSSTSHVKWRDWRVGLGCFNIRCPPRLPPSN